MLLNVTCTLRFLFFYFVASDVLTVKHQTPPKSVNKESLKEIEFIDPVASRTRFSPLRVCTMEEELVNITPDTNTIRTKKSMQFDAAQSKRSNTSTSKNLNSSKTKKSNASDLEKSNASQLQKSKINKLEKSNTNQLKQSNARKIVKSNTNMSEKSNSKSEKLNADMSQAAKNYSTTKSTTSPRKKQSQSIKVQAGKSAISNKHGKEKTTKRRNCGNVDAPIQQTRLTRSRTTKVEEPLSMFVKKLNMTLKKHKGTFNDTELFDVSNAMSDSSQAYDFQRVVASPTKSKSNVIESILKKSGSSKNRRAEVTWQESSTDVSEDDTQQSQGNESNSINEAPSKVVKKKSRKSKCKELVFVLNINNFLFFYGF